MTKKGLFYFSIKDITEIAIMVALAIVIDRFVKIPIGSTGGSLNISAIPLMVVALRHGPFKAFIASGIVYGLITCLWDGYGIATYPMEYLVAFGSIAFFGFVSPFLINNFSKNLNGKLFSILLLLCATVIWSTIRFFAASFDSVMIWEYTWPAAFTYNVTYVFPSAALDLILLSLLLVIVFPIFKIYKTTFYEEVINKANPIEVEIEALEESSTPAEEDLPVEENKE